MPPPAGVAQPRRRNRALAMTALSMTSVQTGAGVSTFLFRSFSPAGATWLRLVWAAVILLPLARPRLRGRAPREAAAAVSLGVVSGLLTLLYFQAVARLPLGTATALEFLGPLAVSLAGLRRRADLAWPAAAVVGVVALTHPWSGPVSLAGVAFGLGAAAGWAGYILLTQRVGDSFPGLSGLAVSMTAAALVTAPFAHVTTVLGRLGPRTLLLSGLAAVLLPLLPYACEMLALRHLNSASFGTLMSFEPAVGTAVGFVLLGQRPQAAQLLGIAAVTVASVGAVRRSARQPPQVDPVPSPPQPGGPRAGPAPAQRTGRKD
jgi:inner membrane transporter RhtA